MEKKYAVVLENQIGVIAPFIGELNHFLERHSITSKKINAVDLVLEEALANIIKYAFDDDQSHVIHVSVDVAEDEVAIRLEDSGNAFNPLTVPRLDKSKPAMERTEDGLGLHLVRNIMRSMSYRRESDKNIFEIWVNR